jgi:hypothetical protein
MAPMRKSLILLPALLCATPALAQPAPRAPFADPSLPDRLTDAVQSVSDAVLDMRVGGLKAAAEGREASPAEKAMTVRDLARRDDPDFERKLHQQIVEAKPRLRRGMKALNEALPQVIDSLQQAERSLDRALANMPDPTYPKR